MTEPSARNTKQELLQALEAEPAGLTLAEIQRRAGLMASRPTLRRRIGELIAEGLVRSHGETKSRRYTAVKRPDLVEASKLEGSSDSSASISVSAEGEFVRRYVNQPVYARKPVSYERALLDAYQPNKTFYLPPTMRRHLRDLGQTTATPQPGGTYARQILQRLLIELSWNSSRLEGNTYSLLDTERLLLEDTPATGKPLVEKQMILNHKAAIEWIVEEVSAGPVALDSRFLRNLHAQLLDNLVADPADIGRVRLRPVKIGSSTYLPLAVPQQLEEILNQLARVSDAITDPFEQSFFLLVHIPYLQPFIDGNKRTARLAANVPLIRDNLRPLTFADLPEHAFVEAVLGVYELRRVELLRDVFAWSYERSCARYTAVQQSLGEPDPFRLTHRARIKESVAALVREGRSADDLEGAAERFSADLSVAERARFAAVLETELHGLHDGNFSRFGLRPAEFTEWLERTKRA